MSPPAAKPQIATGGTTRPNLCQIDRDALDDLGLVDDDRAEMLTAPVSSCVGAQDGSRGNQPTTRSVEEQFDDHNGNPRRRLTT